MATTKIQHPTLERVVYDVPADSAPEWESAGWKVLDDSDGISGTAEGADTAVAAPAAGPLTDTQGSDSPLDSPATGGSTKTTRKAV